MEGIGVRLWQVRTAKEKLYYECAKSGMVRSIKWNKKMLWRQEDSNKSWRQSVGYGIGCSGLRTGCKEL
ncbi:hypothetical protein HID58_093416 [Brassica napus]|uniref:Uncharacterized protein n=1 Tax=Brassica napus TaxID=3708 RepID=A0ABQ7XDG7_BRANA|nr:hypothetical protein HID58_093416 [Brassica napus]